MALGKEVAEYMKKLRRVCVPKLTYEALDFGPAWGAALKGKGLLDCTWSEILWAAITVGKRSIFDVCQYNNYSLYEMVTRVSMLRATLREDATSQKLMRTDIYNLLDPSEKNAFSYFQGLVTSKLLASKLLDTTWLMHLDVYQKDYNIILPKSRPDFIGRNNRDEWIILEAKGRSNAFSNEAQTKAKDQTRQLRKVDGKFPVLRAAVQSYFTSTGGFRCKITDPEEYDKNAFDMTIDKKIFIKNYYAPILNFFDEKNENIIKHSNSYKLVEIKELDLTIGVATPVYDLLGEGPNSFGKLEEIILKEALTTEYNDNKSAFVGNDGVVIITGNSWNTKNMSLEPEKRE